jgi:hypothetical protein
MQHLRGLLDNIELGHEIIDALVDGEAGVQKRVGIFGRCGHGNLRNQGLASSVDSENAAYRFWTNLVPARTAQNLWGCFEIVEGTPIYNSKKRCCPGLNAIP